MRKLFPLLFCVLALVVFAPALARGDSVAADPGATELVPTIAPPPMPKSDWRELVAAGAIGVFLFTETVKRKVPWFTGQRVWLVILPAIAVGAVLQVGYSDPKLLAKHAGFLLLFSVGGRDGLMKIIDKVRRGEIPDPPDTSTAPSKLPALPLLPLGIVTLLCVSCGPAQHPCVALYQKAGEADTAEEIRAQVAEADKVCEHMLEKESPK